MFKGYRLRSTPLLALALLLLSVVNTPVRADNNAPQALFSLQKPASGGSSYGSEGITPYLVVEIENQSPQYLTDLRLDLLIDGQVIYRSLPLPQLVPFQQSRLQLPWTPAAGRQTFDVEVIVASAARVAETSTSVRSCLTMTIRFDEIYLHPWLTRRANEFLQSKYPGGEYAELAVYIEAMVEGATHEDALDADNDDDNATQRFNRHFFRPTDASGLQESPGYPPYILECIDSFCNSLDWGNGSQPHNDYDWLDALDHYAVSELWEAYYALGHLLHLVQDLAVPAHTHLDIHAVSINDPVGDDLENYCQAVLAGGGWLPEPDPDAEMILLQNLDSFWDNPGAPFPHSGLTRLSYYRNRYYCDLASHNDASGSFKEMYPDLDWVYDFWAFEYQWDIDSPDVGNWDEDFGNSCPTAYAGSMGDDEFWSCAASYGNPDSWDYVYVENTEEIPQLEKSSWNPDNPAEDQYTSNSSGLTQTELLAQDLIPLGVRYTAGLMKFYYDTTHPPPPAPPLVAIVHEAGTVTLSWEAVPGATNYRVYSCVTSVGIFLEDLSGTFAGTSWSAPATGARFYRVTAVN